MGSQVYRSSVPSDWLAIDGIYIDERRPLSGIRGIPNNQVCVVGEFERGPVDTLTAVGSREELVSIFGDGGATGTSYKGHTALLNKDFGRLWVVRVSNSSQATGTVDLDDGGGSPVDVLQVDANSPGVWGNSLTVSVVAATDASAGKFDLVVKRSGVQVEQLRNLDPSLVANGAQYLETGSKYVTLTRLAAGATSGRPANAADQALGSGSDGTFADSDYTAASRGINLLAGSEAAAIRYFFCAEKSGSTINTAMKNLAISAPGKIACINGPAANTVAQAISDVANYRSDRVIYAFPWLKTLNQDSGALVTVAPSSFIASLVAGISPGEDPAGVGRGQSHANLLRGVSGLELPALARADYVSLDAAGVAAFWFASEVQRYTLRNGVTTDLTSPDNATIQRRSIADYLQESIAAGLVEYQNQSLTTELRTAIKGSITSFLETQQRLGILPTQEDINAFLSPSDELAAPFSVDVQSGNSASGLASGLLVIWLRVRTHASARYIVLRTEIGPGVEIKVAEVAS